MPVLLRWVLGTWTGVLVTTPLVHWAISLAPISFLLINSSRWAPSLAHSRCVIETLISKITHSGAELKEIKTWYRCFDSDTQMYDYSNHRESQRKTTQMKVIRHKGYLLTVSTGQDMKQWMSTQSYALAYKQVCQFQKQLHKYSYYMGHLTDPNGLPQGNRIIVYRGTRSRMLQEAWLLIF